MGLLDKVKEAASQVGEAAKKGVGQVQTKVEQSQTRKKADDAARQLGYLIVRERTGGQAAGPEADQLVAEIVELEKQLAAAAQSAEAETAPTAEAEAAPQGETGATPGEPDNREGEATQA